jgi:hypothetical protein
MKNFHVFLISALVRVEWSDSRPCRFNPGERAQVSFGYEAGWPQSWSGLYGEVKILDPTGTRNPTSWSSSLWPVAILTTLPLLI